MKRKGFTLIELLAVILVLAVIAVVSVPIVLDVIDDVRKEANMNTVYGIIDGAKMYYADAMFDEEKWKNIENSKNIYDDIIVNGEKPSGGQLYINEEGKVSIYVEIGDTAYIKQFEDETIEETEPNEDIFVGVDGNSPTVDLEVKIENPEIIVDGWYNKTPEVEIKVSDEETGVDYFEWCQGINCEPDNLETGDTTIKLEDSKETQICVIVYDRAGNASEKVCSDIIMIDTIAPEFSGIADIKVNVGEEVDLEKDVEVTDVTSGVKGTFTYTPEKIDTSKTGVTEVIYHAEDNAGNIKEVTRKVIVEATAPTIEYKVTDGIINNNGWAKEDFYVTINVTDNTGHGLKEFRICTATTDTCDPSKGSVITDSTSATRLISTENNNNRICVQATDKTEQTSDVVCSDAYKLDKSVPTAGTINITGTEGKDGWYTSIVTIEVVDGSDGLSGHLSTTVDTTSITSSTTSSGKVVTVTTSDKAGNVSTRTYTLKVDITQLEVTITKESGTTKLTATVSPTSAPSVYSYQWYKDGSLISGATSSTYTPTTAGGYTLKVTTGAGLSDTSNSVTISSYTISYDMNGGTGSISNQTKVQDISLTLSGTTPTRTGYTFQGWATSKTATDKEYSSGGTYTANAGATLYAVWKVNSYTCAAGYYLGTNATSCTKCEAGSYCAGGTYNYSATTQGKSSCPSGYGSSAAGSNEASDCYIQTTAGKYIATANASTQSTCTAGYYCPSTKVYYGNTGTRTQCTVGNYCPSGAGSQTACPSGYTSVAGSGAQSDCYIQTTAGNYIATANSSSQTACTAGYYCLSTKIYYGKTGGRTACPSSHSSSAASSDAQSDCYKTITITYSGNGSTSGSTSNSSCKAYYNNSSCNITLRANGFTKTGYSFKGWGTGTSSVTHNANQQYSFSANDTLYAIWEAAKTISCSNYYNFLDSAGINANYCTSSKDYVMVGNSTATCLSNAYSDVNDLSNGCSQCVSECQAAGNSDCSSCCAGAPSLEELFASTYNSCCDTNGCDTEGTPVLSLVSTSGSMKTGGNTLSTSIRGTGTFTCKSSNTSVATCSISNSTLKITSGSTAGTATITVTSSYGLTATYTVTVISGPTHEECDAEAVAYGNQCGQDCASACSGCQNPNGCNCDCQSAYNSCYSQKYNECMGN